MVEEGELEKIRSDTGIDYLAVSKGFDLKVEVMLTRELLDSVDKVVSFDKESFENRSTFIRGAVIEKLRRMGEWK